MSVRVNFALVDQAFLVEMDEFDRVLDGQHVLVASFIDQIEHGGEGRRLAAARRPRHQDESAGLFAKLTQHGGKLELIEALDLERNHENNNTQMNQCVTEKKKKKAGSSLDWGPASPVARQPQRLPDR